MPSHSPSPAANPTLLLVDDDRLALATTAQGLRQTGYSVVTADSAERALACAGAEVFALAVLDMRMPGLSGIELAHLLECRHGLRSLFLSAHGERREVSEAIAQGALGYLVKPVDPARMVPTIEAALARARDLDALQTAKQQLEQALEGDRVVSVAVGLLMARSRLSEQAAFATLRDEARRQRRKLQDYCSQLVGGAAAQGHGRA
jgi:response regulator NasT